MAQGEFIDLYEILHLPVETERDVLQKRITELYLEAQSNLDHRNPQKRLQYQQMYEIILPQARHLLLDAGRRVEYDRYLTAYRSGTPISQVEARPAAPAAEPVTEIPEMVEAEVDPEVLAAQREALWDKWKSGLDLSEPAAAPKPAPPKTAAPKPAPATPRPAGASAPLNPAPKVGQQVIDKPGTYVASAARRSAAEIAADEEAEKQQRLEFERQRETHRQEMIQSLAQTTILIWSFGAGFVTLAVLSAIIFVLDNYLAGNASYPFLSLERGAFMGACFVLAILLAAAGAFLGSRKGRARTEEQLSPLSYEELQRRTR